jgi:hypothetical protein
VCDVHLALGLELLLLLFGFYFAGHLVLFTVCGVSGSGAGKGRRIRAYSRASRWPVDVSREVPLQCVYAVAPITRFTCANLRVFFWTPMVAVWSCWCRPAVSITSNEAHTFWWSTRAAKISTLLGEIGQRRPKKGPLSTGGQTSGALPE